MIALPFQDRQPRNHLEKAGIEAERQLAHYLCRKFGQDSRVDLFFGLRLPVEKTSTPARHDAVQIDALLIHPHGMAIVESKSIHAHVRVNSRGWGANGAAHSEAKNAACPPPSNRFTAKPTPSAIYPKPPRRKQERATPPFLTVSSLTTDG